jgi:type IV secretion system protein VirB11
MRLEDLLAEVTARPPRRLIAQAVDLIAHIRRDREGRRVERILEMGGAAARGYLLREIQSRAEAPERGPQTAVRDRAEEPT